MVISNRGESVVNYPRLHAQALTRKHQGTNCFFKPLVRILKNIKTSMIEAGYIGEMYEKNLRILFGKQRA